MSKPTPILAARLRKLGLRSELVRSASRARDAIGAVGARERWPVAWRDLEASRAGLLIALFVGGRAVARAAADAALGGDLAALLDAGLLASCDGEIRAPNAVLPVGEALLCAPWDRLPDDSSLHLAGVLPPSPDNWLDIGTGAAIAPLLRGGRRVLGCDVDDEAIACGELGLSLAEGIDCRLASADLFDAVGRDRFALVTFNAPIATDVEATEALLRRFWAAVANHLLPGGVVITHSLADPIGPTSAACAALAGTFVRCRYTPEDFAPGFAVSAWYPSLPTARLERVRSLSVAAPHAQRDWISPEDIG